MATTDQEPRAQGRPSIEELADLLRGRVVVPGDEDYDAARRVWNGMIDRRPALIVMCAGVGDVMAAVTYAREHGLPIAVRGGGHNVAGTAVADDAVVVDVSRMRGVRVDPARGTVWAQAGCTWADVDRETQPFGLAVPGGVVSETGIAGLTLSGGLSGQRRAHGMTIDNLVGCDIVTADGRLLHASADEHPELFWALRGGGGNFGVVTAFEYQAHRHGPEIFVTKVFYPVEQGREILTRWRDAVTRMPEAVTSEAVYWTFPAVPDIPEPMHHAPVLVVIANVVGPVAEAEALTRPLRELGEPIVDASGPTTYVDEQRALDPLFGAGRRYYWKGLYLDALGDDAIDVITERALQSPSPHSPIVVRHLGGAMGRVTAEETAFGDRSAPFHLSVDATWDDPAQDALNVLWTQEFIAAAQRFSSGKLYLNFAGMLEEGDAALRTTFGRNYARLVDVKTAYDPGNVFRFNPNIAPRGTATGIAA
ncbi:MAG: FAD-binding oxidoreductase [Thermoleophilia bacterium]